MPLNQSLFYFQSSVGHSKLPTPPKGAANFVEMTQDLFTTDNGFGQRSIDMGLYDTAARYYLKPGIPTVINSELPIPLVNSHRALYTVTKGMYKPVEGQPTPDVGYYWHTGMSDYYADALGKTYDFVNLPVHWDTVSDLKKMWEEFLGWCGRVEGVKKPKLVSFFHHEIRESGPDLPLDFLYEIMTHCHRHRKWTIGLFTGLKLSERQLKFINFGVSICQGLTLNDCVKNAGL